MTSTIGEVPWGNTPIVGYQLDNKDRIVDVSGAWDDFAIANGAEELARNAVVGYPLRHFVSGDVTRMFLDTMLSKVRLTGKPFSVPYRCDSPGTKRYMEMTLDVCEKSSVVRSTHRLLREEVLAPSLAFLVADPTKQGLGRMQLVKRCSMCNRLTGEDGIPTEPEQFKCPDTERVVKVIYHVCHDCQNRMKRFSLK